MAIDKHGYETVTNEINRLKRLLRQNQISNKEKCERIKYLENIITYLEDKLEGYQIMKVLPMHFYSMPKIASMTVDQKDLKELLLETGGQVIANGSLYEITSKHIGAGVYKVTLTKNIV